MLMYAYEWTGENGIFRLTINGKIQKEIRPVFKEELDYYEAGINKIYNIYLDDIKSNNKESIIYKIFLNHQSSEYLESTNIKRQVIDFIAGMTDDFLIREIKKYE